MAAPANNDLANFTALEGNVGAVEGTTIDATTDTPYDPITDGFDSSIHQTVWYRLTKPSGWVDNESSLRFHFEYTDTPGRTDLEAQVELFEATTYPPTSGADWNFLDGFAPPVGENAHTYIGPAPANDFFYISVGVVGDDLDPTVSTNFVLSWVFAHPDPEGICVAFDSDTLDTTPLWTRLDDSPNVPWKVNGYTISRGRASELDKTGTGTATIQLTDVDGSFDPTNTLGPFYGMLDPRKQAKIMIQNPVTDEWRTLFTGFVSEWLTDIHKTTRFSQGQLELVDGFAILNGVEMYPTAGPQFGDAPPFESEGDIYYPATTGTQQVQKRINDALTDAGWPSLWRHIFSGNIDLQEVVYARGEPVLTVLLDAADAEFPNVANVLMGRRGEVIFRGRWARFSPEDYESTDDDDVRTGPAGTGGRLWFWNAGGRPELDANTAWISDLSWRRSEHDIINTAQAIPKDDDFLFTETEVQGQVYTDSASIALYGRHAGPEMENLLVAEGNTPPGQNMLEETAFYAEYYVENYKNPRTRITRLVFRGLPLSDPYAEPTWGLCCGVEIGDVVTIDTSQFDGAAGFTDDDYFVEGIRYEVNPAAPGMPDLTLELDVSPRGFFDHNPWGTTIPADDQDVLAT